VFRSADAGMSWSDTGLAGCVSAIVIDPKTPSTVYAASRDIRMGVVKSTDGGTNWTAVNSGLPPSIPIYREFPDPIALAIDPETPATLYAGVRTEAFGSPSAISLFKSTNAGKTWTATGLNPTVLGVGSIFNLTIYPQGMGTVYVATASYVSGGALWKSTDGGTSWRNLWPSSSTNVYAVVEAPDDPNVVYAGTDTGVVKSTDSGATWTPIPGSPGYTQVLAFDPQNADTLYAAGPAGLFAITFSGPEAGGTE